MNKYFITLVIACISAVVLLSGCAKETSGSLIDKAIALCENNNGVEWIHSEVGISTRVKCKNGAHFYLK